jgi:hypothetical protein
MSKKLKKARLAIEAILKECDIAGHVALHEPNEGYAFMCLDASYSRLKILPPICEITYESPNDNDDEARQRELASTLDMLRCFEDLLGRATWTFHNLRTALENELGPSHAEELNESQSDRYH